MLLKSYLIYVFHKKLHQLFFHIDPQSYYFQISSLFRHLSQSRLTLHDLTLLQIYPLLGPRQKFYQKLLDLLTQILLNQPNYKNYSDQFLNPQNVEILRGCVHLQNFLMNSLVYNFHQDQQKLSRIYDLFF